jgi:hypothetical protein
MLKRVRPRLTFANVMSCGAMFVALGGVGAYAANEWNGSNIQDGTLTGADIQDLSLGLPDYGANSISTGKLKDGDVRTADLRDLNVTNPKIAWDSISSGKVIDNNLTGNDINEATITGARLTSSSRSDNLPLTITLPYDVPARGTILLTGSCDVTTQAQPVVLAVALGNISGVTVDEDNLPANTSQLVTGTRGLVVNPGAGSVTGSWSEARGDGANCSGATLSALYVPFELDGTAP